MDEHGAITQSGSGRQVDFDDVPGVVRPDSDSDSSVEFVSESDEDSDGFDDMGLDFELDFGNRLSIEDDSDTQGSSSSTSSPLEILDESIFELDDF
mmetsp:Transcript_486/g.1249  ORF Transcript_486/g.1249 Transcript_486/m.1249 type:complete len:96 (+) Transcript_486:443-730(+)